MVIAWWSVMIATATVLPAVWLAGDHFARRERRLTREAIRAERRRTEAIVQAVMVRLAQHDQGTVSRIRQH